MISKKVRGPAKLNLYKLVYYIYIYVYTFFGSTVLSGPEPLYYLGFTITQWHNTGGRTPLDEWLAQNRDLYLTTHNTHNTQHTQHKPQFQQGNDLRPMP